MMQEVDEDEKVVLTPHLTPNKMGAFTIEKLETGSLVVSGKRIEQFTKMTDFQSEGGVLRFKDVIDRIGLKKALRNQSEEGCEITIGGIRVDQYI